MKYSVSNWIFGKEDLETYFRRLAKFGYHGMELRREPGLYKVGELTSSPSLGRGIPNRNLRGHSRLHQGSVKPPIPRRIYQLGSGS